MKQAVKRMLPAALITKFRGWMSRLDLLLVRFFSLHPLLAGIYYILLSRRFDKEHLAVLKGRLRYAESQQEYVRSSALLRRNTHRLEKGLIMRPRRSVFAEEFITETVRAYQQAMLSPDFCSDELKWAKDVLDAYFSVVADTVTIKKARANYEQIKIDESSIINDGNAGYYRPYTQFNAPLNGISFQQLEMLYTRRRSVRWYKDLSVHEDVIRKAVDIASLAPSACNRQPYRFLVATDKANAVTLAKCAGGTVGFAENLPSLVVVVGDLSAYPFERDRHLIYIDGSLASMQFMLALETLGLSSCPINWPDVDLSERRIRKVVQLAPYERVVMLIAVGYADETGGIAYSQKKKSSLLMENV